jgi:ABC-type multidrug transport system ATPase subunit
MDAVGAPRLKPGQVATLDTVTVRGRDGTVIGPVSFSLDQGEWLSVFGPSGSGKSAVLRMLSGEIRPEAGPVVVAGGVRHATASQELASPARVGARDKVLRRLARFGVPPLQRDARAGEALEIMDLIRYEQVPENALSIAQRMALDIASALACRPELMLLDGATACLPEPLAARLFAALDDRRAADGLAVVHATCSATEAERSDRVLMLDDGRVLAWEATADLLRRHAPERITVEADDPACVRRTLRGIYDIEIMETGGGLRFSAADPVDAASQVFRHPPAGLRAVYVGRGNLWQAYSTLKRASSASGPGSPPPPQ